MDRKEREVVKCCVPFCTVTSANSKSTSFYSFPKERNLKEGWITALREKDLYSEIIRDHGPRAISRMFVCSTHFTQDDFKEEDAKSIKVENALVKRSLTEGAVPSVFPNLIKIENDLKPEEQVEIIDVKPVLKAATVESIQVKLKTEPEEPKICTSPGRKTSRPSFSIKDVSDKMSMAVRSSLTAPEGQVAVNSEKRKYKKRAPKVPVRCSPRTKTPVLTSVIKPPPVLPPPKTEKARPNPPKNTHVFPKKNSSSYQIKKYLKAKKPKPTLRKGKRLSLKPGTAAGNCTATAERTSKGCTDAIIATALSRLSEVAQPPNRPVHKRYWHARKKVLSKSAFHQSLESSKIPRNTKTPVENVVNADPRAIADLIRNRLSSVATPAQADTNAFPQNPVRKRGRPPLQFQPTRPISLPFRKRIKKVPPGSVLQRVPYSAADLSECPPERKEAMVIQNMFSNAITKVFSSPGMGQGRKPKMKNSLDYLPQPDSSNVYRWLTLNAGVATDADNDEYPDFIHGELESENNNYEFEGSEDHNGYTLPAHPVINMDVDESDGEGNEETYDPLGNENGYVRDHIVKVDALDLEENEEDEYATPLLNGFGIVTDEQHDPIPSSLVEVKTELVQDSNAKMDADEYAILPSTIVDEEEQPDDDQQEQVGQEEENFNVDRISNALLTGSDESETKNPNPQDETQTLQSTDIVMKQENVEEVY